MLEVLLCLLLVQPPVSEINSSGGLEANFSGFTGLLDLTALPDLSGGWFRFTKIPSGIPPQASGSLSLQLVLPEPLDCVRSSITIGFLYYPTILYTVDSLDTLTSTNYALDLDLEPWFECILLSSS